jgi:hypothetical protein
MEVDTPLLGRLREPVDRGPQDVAVAMKASTGGSFSRSALTGLTIGWLGW